MEYSYNIAILTHLSLIWILILSDIYIGYILKSKIQKTIQKIQKIKLFLPFVYTILSIVFFTGLSLSFLNISTKVFIFDFHYQYMIFAILFFLISKIKIYKQTKTITSRQYAKQIYFIQYAKKMVFRSGIIMLIGVFI
ncbi:hypothetical protein MNB_ARC-1_849 [hydrothermal vent metagenome]|uniref:Uncharacterized protein n=1 Tax=hydrothermal vent metagenome TaxID=652676 RepID=A0A3B1E6L0_9ZZZZ